MKDISISEENFNKIKEEMLGLYPNMTENEIINYTNKFINGDKFREILTNYICWCKHKVN